VKRGIAIAAVLATALVAALAGAHVGSGPTQAAAADNGCQLNGKQIKHVIYLQFDNTHYNRDNPNVASELEQMPHLLNFLQQNGTLFTNDHTILISHTAGGILSSLTGLYPDRNGQTVSNSYGFYAPGVSAPKFTSSFKYWTAPVDPTFDTLPNMITNTGKTTPAPWAPFTRAGCDVGGVGTANIELENASNSTSGDITKVFGQGTDEWNEAATSPQLAQTDFVGIAIHCAQTSNSVCAGNEHAKDDLLPDEPGRYEGYKALFGTKYVDPAITGGKACVNDTNGQPITDAIGNCGFPGFDGMLAKNTLGYVAAMQEAGVPITYGYISDAHDLHVPNLAGDSYASSATGPGEITHNQQLKEYDDAFASFFSNLQSHGINKQNTLFVVTVDEGDHFAGGVGAPTSGDWLVYDHRTCTDLHACPSNQIGEIGYNLKSTLPGNYSVHSDDAPTFYVNGQPGPTDATVRALERNATAVTQFDPYSGSTVNIAQGLIDVVGEQAIHMVNADAARTPTFTMFGNPDFFFQTSAPCGTTTNPIDVCVTPGFAWNHGDMQNEIGSTWVGMVGPGVASGGVNSTTWTDHTNLRPTIMSLLGLQDDYLQDGFVLTPALDKQAVPSGLSGSYIPALQNAYEQVNASFGAFSMAVIKASSTALAGDDATYSSIESSITSLTTQRNTLAATIRGAFNSAANGGNPITQSQAQGWIAQANQLISQAQALS
jgi:hypothetical protein